MNIFKSPEDVIKMRLQRRGYSENEINEAFNDKDYRVMRLNKKETPKFKKKNC